MSEPYDEILYGEKTLRLPPGNRHELVCFRLYTALRASVANLSSTRLLEVRTAVRIDKLTVLRPDITLIVAATGKPWLVAEIISSEDHKTDTVFKKEVFESIKIPRLWMVDPRYDNVEVYHSTDYGLKLVGMLTGQHMLSEKLLPEFEIGVASLFGAT